MPRTHSIWRSEAVAVGFAAAVFAAVFSYPVLSGLGRIGVVWDWPEFLIRNWVAFHSVHQFRQFPLWNPYECGGMPLLAHPSSQIVTPLFALSLLFGPFAGLNLQIPAHLAIAWSGGYVLGKVLGMGPLGRLICASIFPASSWFYLHIGVGHLNFLPTAYLPWVAAAVLTGCWRRSLVPWILAGLLLALMFGEGGVYQPTQAAMLAGMIVLWMAAVRRSWWPFLGMFVMLAFAAGFAAVKLAPSVEMMRMHPRPVEDIEYTPVRVLLQGLFTHYQFYDRSRIEAWGFWEVGAYLGPAAAVLAVLGLVGRWRRSVPWLVAAGLFFLLAVGGPWPWFPWALLHHLPVFAWERVPERFLILFVLAAGVMAGFGADFLAGLYRPMGAIAAGLLLLAALADGWTVSYPNMHAPVDGGLGPVKSGPHFVQDYQDPWSMLTLARSNRGALHCNEELDFHDVDKMKVVALNQPGYKGEQYLLGPGMLEPGRWTPNALSYDVNTPTPNVLVINQNYDSNWRLVQGLGVVMSYKGLLAVHLPAGIEHVRLVFHSNAFALGGLISLLTCVVALSLWLWEGRPGRTEALENRSMP
jgi:hypothetical protein